MALSNAEKQARWREKHIAERRDTQRLANLLMRKHVTREQIADVAAILKLFFNREGIRELRRALSRMTKSRRDGSVDRYISASAADQCKAMEDEQEDWEREFPGKPYPELECALSDREYTDLWRWRRQRGRKARQRGAERAEAEVPRITPHK